MTAMGVAPGAMTARRTIQMRIPSRSTTKRKRKTTNNAVSAGQLRRAVRPSRAVELGAALVVARTC